MYITSESVTEGHPDKIADQIADAILDEFLAKDSKSRVAIEVLITNGICFIAGEVTTSCYVDVAKIARKTIKEIGYTDSRYGFHFETSGIEVAIKEQSSDIARGVDAYTSGANGAIIKEDLTKLGAGDQGIMYGYACNETPELMPLPIVLANRLTERLAEVRKKGIIKGLRPDGKAQITIEYGEITNDKLQISNNKQILNSKPPMPKRIDTIVIAAQHEPDVKISKLKSQISKYVIVPVLKTYHLPITGYNLFANATGRFVIGGPQADTGLTGRKNIVDTYGGVIPHGGGALSGKDPTKVDRSGQYAARWVAKNIVAADIAKRCLVQIAYVIGVPKPLVVQIETFNTSKYSDEAIVKAVEKTFDLRPGMIIEELGLRKPIYSKIACYGHFGRPELNLPWEKTNKIKDLQKLF